MMRLTAFLILIALGLTVPWQLFVIGIGLYAFHYEGYELLPLAFLFDAFVGISVPWLPVPAIYTIATLGIMVFVWGMKPLFLIESRVRYGGVEYLYVVEA